MPGSKQNEFVNYLVDLMQSIGPVNARRMFGGHGLFLNGLMFALIADDTLYFKADGESEARFTAKGLKAFTYDRKGKPCSLAYYEAPEDSLENIEQMIIWANRAYAAALRAPSARRR